MLCAKENKIKGHNFDVVSHKLKGDKYQYEVDYIMCSQSYEHDTKYNKRQTEGERNR